MRVLKYILLFFFLFSINPVFAVVDPLSVPNNRVGVHILQPDEIFQAARLVNSNGGGWGYVTIPIRSNDRDREKWIRFFIQCGQNRLIPIIRLATYTDGVSWVAPTTFDLIDFANFLNDMPWPVKNRYVIIFNEPNHANEWGGTVSPSGYASVLIEAREIFKSRSDDFFILNAGLDMSAPNSQNSLDALQFYRQMTKTLPGWYSAIDGFSAHAYPNPGFSSSPLSSDRRGITSYRYEVNLLKSFKFNPKPVFITETGFIGQSEFYRTAYTSVWQEKNIVAITPFVLFAGAGEFLPFSLTDLNHQPKSAYLDIFNLPKVSGSPLLNNPETELVNKYSFTSGATPVPSSNNFLQNVKDFFFPPPPRLAIGGINIFVEITNTYEGRSKGLSGRKSLLPDYGMLFSFPQAQIQTFWMKDMNFSLDFVWINHNRVVNLTENIPPPSQTGGNPVIISSAVIVDQVLEVNAGFIKNHSLIIGDLVVLKSP